MRLQYPPNLRIIEVPCTGKVDIIHLLQAFEYGADGVIVVGCMEGDCHYQGGNLYAKKRVKRAKEILDKVGLGGERVAMYQPLLRHGGQVRRDCHGDDQQNPGTGTEPHSTCMGKGQGR